VRIYSVGHGARSVEELIATLQSGAVERVADVRSFPNSRRNPQFGHEALARSLEAAGIGYAWLPKLGGRRKPSKDPSPNPAWRVEAFRSYADYMDTDEFAEGLDALLRLAVEKPTAFMCAETHPSKCHRRLIADKLWALGHEVVHLITPDRVEAHLPPPFLRVEGDRLLYDRT
jgi:uncharacterized protein (DUF488 family)